MSLLWLHQLLIFVICRYDTTISKHPESICFGASKGYSFVFSFNIDLSGRYDLINNDFNDIILPTYYSNDLKLYLYPLTSLNITYYPWNSYAWQPLPSNINNTYYFISKQINNASISNPHCMFNTSSYNGTFDLTLLCSQWQILYPSGSRGLALVTTYYECLQEDISSLCITNKYHKFIEGTYSFSHWNYTWRGPIYYCSECDNNGGMYIYPWLDTWTLSGRYEVKIHNVYTNDYAFESCTLNEKQNDLQYIFDINDCKNLWRSYHDSDWYHDESISIIDDECPFKLTTLHIVLITISCVIICCCGICYKLKHPNCCKRKNQRRSCCKRRQYITVNAKQLDQEFEIFKQKEEENMFKGWDEATIDWTFDEKENKENKGNNVDDVNQIEIKSSDTNCIMVNPYFLVEKGLKQCFLNDWEIYLDKFKNELITDDTLKLIQDLNDEKQNIYLEKVLKIGDLLTFKKWLSSTSNLQQIEGM